MLTSTTGRVVSRAIGACSRAIGDGSQSLRREEIIDMRDAVRTNVSPAEDVVDDTIVRPFRVTIIVAYHYHVYRRCSKSRKYHRGFILSS